MSWASHAIEKLKRGEPVTIRPHGNSMRPKINSGDRVDISPDEDYNKGDIVLVKVRGRVYLHLIKAIKDDRFLIGNNHGRINGWANKKAIYGKVVKISK